MANNTVEVQVIRDDDRYSVIKVRGLANATWSAQSVLLQANSLMGANTSIPIVPLSLTDIKFSVDVAPAGFVDIGWISNINTNVSLFSFGSVTTGEWNGFSIQNNANTPPGDLYISINSLGIGNSFNFIMTFVKDQAYFLNGIPYGQIAWANTPNAYFDSSGH
jgi:hypothetical protein